MHVNVRVVSCWHYTHGDVCYMQLLIGYETGLSVLWDLREKVAEFRYNSPEVRTRSILNNIVSALTKLPTCIFNDFLTWLTSPLPSSSVHIIHAMTIVWRIRGKKIIRTVLCCIDSCAQWYAHACEQFLKMSVGLGLGLVFAIFLGLAFCVCVFWLSLDYFLCCLFFMVALCNRADHYIFALWFLSFFFLFFPRLISAVGDWMSTILPHMVWP